MCLPLSDKKPDDRPAESLPPVIQYPVQVPIPPQPNPVAIVLPTVKKPAIQLVAKPVPLEEKEEKEEKQEEQKSTPAPVVHITPAVHHHHHKEQQVIRPLIQIHRTASK